LCRRFDQALLKVALSGLRLRDLGLGILGLLIELIEQSSPGVVA
jgi:hypothetical protein